MDEMGAYERKNLNGTAPLGKKSKGPHFAWKVSDRRKGDEGCCKSAREAYH